MLSLLQRRHQNFWRKKIFSNKKPPFLKTEVFLQFFPEYKERKLLGAVAGIVIDEGVDRYAYQQGLFVIVQRGDTVRLLNDADFQPKEW